MKKLKIKTILLASLMLIIGLILGWVIFGNSVSSDKGMHTHELVNEEDKIWTCSMHPQIRQNEAGNCPICGMDLIPLKNNLTEGDPQAIRMSETAMKLAEVETSVVNRGKVRRELRLNGKVQVDERSLFTQSSHIPGRIERVELSFTGEYVTRGQVIAHIFSSELITAQEELFEAHRIRESQPVLFEAAKQKLKSWKLKEAQIESLLKTQKVIRVFPILAEVTGYVTKKMVNRGDYIRQGEGLYEIADLSKVWALFEVYEADLNQIAVGDEIVYLVPSMPDKVFKGLISYIDPVIHPKLRVARARVDVNNKDFRLRPEMFVSGIVHSNFKMEEGSVFIPKAALLWTGKRSIVYVKIVSDQGVSFKMREVTLGPSVEGGFIVLNGLLAGEEIATNGTFSIDAAAQLQGKPSMMNPRGGSVPRGHNHGKEEHDHSIGNKDVNVSTISYSDTNSISFVINEYMQMKDYLIKDNWKQAKGQGFSLTIKLEKLSWSKKDLNQNDSYNVLKKALAELETKTDLKGVRQAFTSLSSEITNLIKSKEYIPKNLYVHYCPMANFNKGASWLSLDEKVENPYFGNSMLNCGELVEIIKSTIQI